MTWTPNPATLRLQAIKAGKNTREPETKKVDSKKGAHRRAKKEAKKPVKSSQGGRTKGPAQKNKKPIKQVAKKRARQLRKYTKLRKVFLEAHPECEIPVEGCTVTATEVHHAGGRENELLLDISRYKAACHNCHTVATEKSKQAISDGRSLSRHSKPEKNNSK